MLQPGMIAPDFTLSASLGESFTLSQNRGKRLVLAFYPADWSPVCSDQMTFYNEMLDYFTDQRATLVGISVDGKWCHAAFSNDRKLDFPLLADFEPKGAVSRTYEVYDEEAGESKRALYVIDENGIIRWSYLSPVDVNPGAAGILQALDDMNNVTQ
ncbi:redoxin domain-containing protein [Niastella sp. OAS944]|uniref:redoxin domain-containing protein n=1 Tax=Niastella sp. OAS944 TaxID=2664089 RepID=UPI00346C7D0C|nr:peroxiredoxin [Chitinophagaceae bacterium OAS944]